MLQLYTAGHPLEPETRNGTKGVSIPDEDVTLLSSGCHCRLCMRSTCIFQKPLSTPGHIAWVCVKFSSRNTVMMAVRWQGRSLRIRSPSATTAGSAAQR